MDRRRCPSRSPRFSTDGFERRCGIDGGTRYGNRIAISATVIYASKTASEHLRVFPTRLFLRIDHDSIGSIL